ncbi:MAG: MurT ligase domain-containing protein [Nocardiaceae bacterium]|nr:MurT ligase domain-containing protein [Nocardiaceae bacterium]
MRKKRQKRFTVRGRTALASAKAAAWASRKTGRGAGAMIGGLIALKVDKSIMAQLGRDRKSVLITGTNGKSTTTRMAAAALANLDSVATQQDGANMDAGIVAALTAHRDAPLAAIEVDELHLPHVADELSPAAIVLLNLSRDQLDRVGEINMIERKLREGLQRHPEAVIVANCDDILVTSAAYDNPNVVWVAAGSGWALDSVSCPRSGEPIVRDGDHWYSTGTDFKRPTPDWHVDDNNLYGPNGLVLPMKLGLPGKANRGNAAQAVAAAVAMGVLAADAVKGVESVREIAGRYSTIQVGDHHTVRMLLAKNPAGWQEALSMVDHDASGLVIAVNGQVPDGEDLSWLWDVHFEHFHGVQVVASGERGTDLAVRLTYADVDHTLVADPLKAILTCPPGKVEVLANYTAFRDLNTALAKAARNG